MRQAEEFRLQGIKQDIKLAVALRYLEIFSRRANLKVAEDSFNTLNKLHEDAINRFQVGLINKSEMLKFKVDLDNAIIFRDKARAQLDQSQALLVREVGTDLGVEEFGFEEFVEVPELEDQDKYRDEMLVQRSELRFLEEMAEAAAFKVNVERALYYPRVDVAGIYSKTDDDPVVGNGTAADEEVRTQVVLSMNLFDGFGHGDC